MFVLGGWKRLLIGSVAPICTYNECKGCKYRCMAEQVPLERKQTRFCSDQRPAPARHPSAPAPRRERERAQPVVPLTLHVVASPVSTASRLQLHVKIYPNLQLHNYVTHCLFLYLV